MLVCGWIVWTRSKRRREMRRCVRRCCWPRRKDQNPAVRMKALEALKDSASDDAVREALLDALAHDANPGVRVEVVNMLVHSLEHESQGSNMVSYPKLAGTSENADDQSDEHADDFVAANPTRCFRMLQ